MARKYIRRKVEIQAAQLAFDHTLADFCELAAPFKTELVREYILGLMILKVIVATDMKFQSGDWLVRVESGKLLHYSNEKFQQEFKEAR